MKRILLTGSKGFTGRYLVPLLHEQDYEVSALASDLTHKESLAKEISDFEPDAVIHLAGISYVPAATGTEVYHVNTVGTQNLLDACISAKKTPERVIIASTANVYGRTSGVLAEDIPPAPVNHYGCSKLAMEFIAKTYEEHFKVIITRPFNYTGVGQSPNFLLPKIVEHFAKRAPTIQLGNIDISRDFSDVRWIADAYVHLLESPDAKGTYNLCSGVAHSIKEIIAHLSALTRHEITINVDPNLVRANDILYQVGSNERLRLQFSKAPIALEETLDWMLNAYQISFH